MAGLFGDRVGGDCGSSKLGKAVGQRETDSAMSGRPSGGFEGVCSK